MHRSERKTFIRIREILKRILRIIGPAHCSCCRAVLPLDAQSPYFCKRCFRILRLLPLSYCSKCGKPLDIVPGSKLCPKCVGDNTLSFDTFVAPFKYKGAAKLIVKNLKYHSIQTAAETLAYFIYQKLALYDLINDIECFVPAPISAQRLAKRGYNQTELICKQLSSLTGIPYINALEKTKHTKPQSTLTKSERLTNLDGSISIKENLILPKKVAFIDDVLTTGTTASYCCRLLKSAGASKVIVTCACINVSLNDQH